MMLPTGSAPVPATLDWEQWLGPAKDRPYHPEYLPFIWRGWWDFGTGALGDMACHLMDGAFWSLNLSYPTAVETEGELANRVSAPKWMIARYDFPQRGEMPPVRLTWYEGGKKIPQELLGATKLDAGFNGSLFVGDKGKMLVPHGGDPQVLDAALQSIPAPDRVTKPAPNGHYREWVDACRTGGPTGSNFDYAAPMTESILLGIVAFRTGTRVQYDAKNMQAVNSPDADDYIQYHSRKGWKLAS
jgi:predicted dehydrogenase